MNDQYAARIARLDMQTGQTFDCEADARWRFGSLCEAETTAQRLNEALAPDVEFSFVAVAKPRRTIVSCFAEETPSA